MDNLSGETLGRHVIVDLRGADQSVCLGIDKWQEAFAQASQQLNAITIATKFHTFKLPSSPGITGYLLLDASHISVHTYVEGGRIALDVFACVNKDIDGVVDQILVQLGISKDLIVQRHSFTRLNTHT